MHDEFKDLVLGTWNRDQNLSLNLQQFTKMVMKWNEKVYGNIFHKKKVLLKRLQGIEDKLHQDHKGYLANTQKDL